MIIRCAFRLLLLGLFNIANIGCNADSTYQKPAEQYNQPANNVLNEDTIPAIGKSDADSQDNSYVTLDRFENKKEKSKSDYEVFFRLLLSNKLSDLAENIEGYFETILEKNHKELQEVLYYASIDKNSEKLKKEISNYFCNIYYMQDENFERKVLKSKIEKDFSFTTNQSNSVFTNAIKQEIFACYFK